MATPYIDRDKLAALVGASTLQKAEQAMGANVDAVIAATCATADGYVRMRTLVANAIVAQMLPDGVVKGGSAVRMPRRWRTRPRR